MALKERGRHGPGELEGEPYRMVARGKLAQGGRGGGGGAEEERLARLTVEG